MGTCTPLEFGGPAAWIRGAAFVPISREMGGLRRYLPGTLTIKHVPGHGKPQPVPHKLLANRAERSSTGLPGSYETHHATRPAPK